MNRSDEWADYLDPTSPDPALPPAHREALDRLARTLADEAVWTEPPASMRASILDAAMREQAAPGGSAAPLPAPRFPDGATRRRRGGSGRRGWWISLAGAAAAAALIIAVAWPRPETTTFALSGTPRAPGARATAELDSRPAGLAIRLEIKGLAAAPQGTYYAAWLRGPDGVVPVGSFHWRRGGIPIDLWSGVLADRYPELFVTLQSENLPPTPSSDIVLRGTVHPPSS